MKTLLLAAMLALAVTAVSAQENASTQRLTFDRPEAWALNYFVSSTMLSGLDVPGNHQPGSISIGLEAGWLPPLSAAQQRVGFYGTAPQDLNKAPIMVRPRVTVGLPGRLAVTAAGNPPIRSFGVTPRLVSGAIDWAMIDRKDWRLAVRGHGQTGTVTGAFTCPAPLVDVPPGSAGNPSGCTAESADVATLRYAGIEFAVSRRLGAVAPHVAVGANYIDSRYEVRAQAYGRPDNDDLATAGWTMSTSAGLTFALTERLSIAGDAFYSPLMVRRSPVAQKTLDGFLNARGLIEYRLR
jgi:hypothetical protein